jgi:Na+/melibiose symporter-like transporter
MLCCAVQALLACFLIPLLLQVIREAHKQQGPRAAAALGVGCGLVLLCCDAVSRSLRRQAAAQQAACVTADTLQQCMQTGVWVCRCDNLGLSLGDCFNVLLSTV